MPKVCVDAREIVHGRVSESLVKILKCGIVRVFLDLDLTNTLSPLRAPPDESHPQRR